MLKVSDALKSLIIQPPLLNANFEALEDIGIANTSQF